MIHMKPVGEVSEDGQRKWCSLLWLAVLIMSKMTLAEANPDVDKEEELLVSKWNTMLVVWTCFGFRREEAAVTGVVLN